MLEDKIFINIRKDPGCLSPGTIINNLYISDVRIVKSIKKKYTLYSFTCNIGIYTYGIIFNKIPNVVYVLGPSENHINFDVSLRDCIDVMSEKSKTIDQLMVQGKELFHSDLMRIGYYVAGTYGDNIKIYYYINGTYTMLNVDPAGIIAKVDNIIPRAASMYFRISSADDFRSFMNDYSYVNT